MSLVRGLILTALFAALPSTAVAQNLDDILNRDRLLVQKLFDEVNAAVEKSRTLQKNEPAKARVVLEEALAKIQSSESCPEDQRALLRRRVNTRLTDINNQIREVMLAAEEAARKVTVAAMPAAHEIARESVFEPLRAMVMSMVSVHMHPPFVLTDISYDTS